jgi:hypothetical protein
VRVRLSGPHRTKAANICVRRRAVDRSIVFGDEQSCARREGDRFKVTHGLVVFRENVDMGGLTLMDKGASVLFAICEEAD